MLLRYWTLALILLPALSAGCGRRAPSPGATLRYALTVEPASFDPAVVNESGTGDLLQHIYDGLVQFGADNRIDPALAEKWDVSPDGRTYTFHLRRATFHNGREITAEDVNYSFERALQPETKSS